MSIFKFVKNAGSRLGTTIYDAVNGAEPPPAATIEINPEKLKGLRAESITENILESRIPVNGLEVSVEDDTVTITGSIASQENCEKIILIAGNQAGIARVDCQLEVINPAPQARFYSVVSGDTLGKIATNFYNDSSQYRKIFEANQAILSGPDKIYVGQTLRIPV